MIYLDCPQCAGRFVWQGKAGGSKKAGVGRLFKDATAGPQPGGTGKTKLLFARLGLGLVGGES